MSGQTRSGSARSFLERRIFGPVKTQLTQGASPRSLSRAIAAGSLLGVFPILGTTTLLVTLAGVIARLNQTVLQTINWFTYPLQIVLILPFIRLGERLHRADPMPFSIPQLLDRFQDSPAGFFVEFGVTMWHAIAGWLVVAPLLWLAIEAAIRPVLIAAAERLAPRN